MEDIVEVVMEKNVLCYDTVREHDRQNLINFIKKGYPVINLGHVVQGIKPNGIRYTFNGFDWEDYLHLKEKIDGCRCDKQQE